MSVCWLEIERGEALWVTAHDERGAIEMASAHVAGDVALNEATSVKLTHDADGTVILQAAAGQWSAAARSDRGVTVRR